MKFAAVPASLVLLLAFSVFGQDLKTESVPTPVVQTLSNKLKSIESASGLDETVKAKAIDAYKQAIASATSVETSRNLAKSFKAKADEVDGLLTKAKADAGNIEPQSSVDTTNLTLQELDKAVQREAVEFESLKQSVTEANDSIASREKRLLEIPTALAEANAKLSQIEADLNVSPPDGEQKVVSEAKSALSEQQKAALQSQVAALKAENAWHVASGELLPVHLENARKRRDAKQAELELWQNAAREKRETEVDRHVREAEQALADVVEGSLKELRPLAGANVQTAKDRRETESELKSATERQSELQGTFNRLEQQFKRARQEAQAQSTISQSLGEVLRERRIELRSIEQTLPDDSSLQSQVSKERLQLFLVREESAELEDLDATTRAKAAELRQSDGYKERLQSFLAREESRDPGAAARAKAAEKFSERYEDDVRIQLELRKTLLKGLETDTEALFGTLAKLEGTVSGLKSLSKDYAQFIDERVLWIRSADAFGIQQFKDTASSAVELTNRSGWAELPSRLVSRLTTQPFLPTLALAALIPLMILSYRLRTVVRDCGEKAKSGNCRDFGFTWRAALLTLALGFVWPAAFYFVGIWLRSGRLIQNDVTTQLSVGFLSAGAVLLPLELWRQTARKLGLMESHFGIAENVTAILRRNLRWLTYVLVPLIATASIIRASGNPIHEQSLGRVVFVTSMLVLAFFLYRVGNPKGGASQGYLARRSDSVLFKGRFVLFWLLVSVPLAFAAIALFGYQFTAEQLAIRLLWSCFLVLGIWFLQALALRWVVLSRRRLAIEQARARLAKASEQSEKDPVTAEAQANLEAIDLGSVDQQTRRLVRAIAVVAGTLAIWSLWVDVLPALSKIGDVRAWEVSVATVVSDTSSETGDTSPNTTTTVVDEVTYGEVFKAIAIFCIMLLAMRDLPGLLELVLLQRLPLDVALRFAITTLTRYVIFVVGTAWALGTIHIGWSKVQWLVAGVSVGLGFGLQEIFANFVSGLIILFERPLRAGDIVTIDGVTGTVKSVRMRATIIQDLDRKDFVVPNKDFITGRLLNWTLSDEVSRIVLPVGVAYGSDTDKAKELMLSAATSHEQIVDEPPPQVTFEAFGDSSLNLVLRCFISLQNMPSRLKIVDELHSTIDAAFRDADIEIPFPQRDLHLRSSDVEPSISLNNGATTKKDTSKAKDAR